MRDLDKEFQDTADRKYAYSFDYIMHEYFMDEVLSSMPKGRALELGCFEGRFTQHLERHYDDVTVVEGSQDLVETAKGNVGREVTFVCSLFEDFEPAEKFDAVFLIHTMEHLEQPQVVLAKIRTWLAPGGRLFVAVPNAHAASRRIAVEMNLIDYPTAVTPGEFAHGHRRTYNLDSLKHEVRAAKFSVVTSGGVMFKALANFQFDRCLELGIIDRAFLDGSAELGKLYPDLCASIFAVCEVGPEKEVG
jgi:2-polyprenyl-3-methyl-5-hydroxy-6-metoxy-1,4-benzoquinol methylase